MMQLQFQDKKNDKITSKKLEELSWFAGISINIQIYEP